MVLWRLKFSRSYRSDKLYLNYKVVNIRNKKSVFLYFILIYFVNENLE